MIECVSRCAGRTVLTCANRRSETDARRATLHSSLFTLHSSGFTLIELLVVTVVIVTLMGIVFRLAGVGGDSRAKSKTLARMQRIENAISGYYAAYGSYPPVPLQGRSRSINVAVDSHGVQGPPTRTRPVNLSNPDDETKKQVEAACRAQPLAVLFPFFMSNVDGNRKGMSEKLVAAIAMEKKGRFTQLRNVGGLELDKSDWHDVQLFQFGLLSFLLPRYLFMLQGDPEMYDRTSRSSARRIGQWAANNQLPSRLDTGQTYESWEDIQKYLYGHGSSTEASIISNLTSQAVCARWMPNFEKIISGGLVFYGVDTSDDDWRYLDSSKYNGLPGYCKWLRVFSPGGFESSSSEYLLNCMTIGDGWGNEFYYCTDTPYQSYHLWSAGPNRLTFPPWLDVSEFNQREQQTITSWTKDDLSHLAN